MYCSIKTIGEIFMITKGGLYIISAFLVFYANAQAMLQEGVAGVEKSKLLFGELRLSQMGEKGEIAQGLIDESKFEELKGMTSEYPGLMLGSTLYLYEKASHVIDPEAEEVIEFIVDQINKEFQQITEFFEYVVDFFFQGDMRNYCDTKSKQGEGDPHDMPNWGGTWASEDGSPIYDPVKESISPWTQDNESSIVLEKILNYMKNAAKQLKLELTQSS
jgi:hypothetical protein